MRLSIMLNISSSNIFGKRIGRQIFNLATVRYNALFFSLIPWDPQNPQLIAICNTLLGMHQAGSLLGDLIRLGIYL